MPFFTRVADSSSTPTPSRPKTSLETPSNPYHQVDHNSSSSWGLTASPPTPPPTRLETPKCPTISSTSSWDVTTFPETSYLLPNDRNGDWRTNTAGLIKHSSATASSLHSTVSWSHLRVALSSAVDLACETVEENINHAFAGHDLPAMHNRVMNLVPSVALPKMHEISHRVDTVSDRAQALMQRQRSAPLVNEDLSCDELWFARHMSAKARRALVSQGICQKWQILATRETVEWHTQLENALTRVYDAEKGKFSDSEMFGMRPVWKGDVEMGMWRLELDTGVVEVVEGEVCEEKNVCLSLYSGLPERMGRVRVKDMERGVMQVGEWMAVE
jgi:hypothetical protein